MQNAAIVDWKPWTENEDGEALLSLAGGTNMTIAEKNIAQLTIETKQLAEEAITHGQIRRITGEPGHRVGYPQYHVYT